MSGAVIVMARRPVPGAVKTRLCPPLSPASAADLYYRFLLDTLDLVRELPGVLACLAYPEADDLAYFRWLCPDFELIPQVGHTLGERLDHVLCVAFGRGLAPAVAVSSDSPTLPVAYVERAFAILESGSVELVLGPCADGGYYLIGLLAPQPRLLRKVPMSTPTVLRDTLALAAREGLRAALLPEWYDVDVAQDLARLETELRSPGATGGRHTRTLLARRGPE